MDSLEDDGDMNRPQFYDENDYVGGVVLVMGTDFDPLGFLDDIWKFSGIFNGPDMMNKSPRPVDLSARTLQGLSIETLQSGEKATFSTLLLWEPAEAPRWRLDDLDGVVVSPYRYAILRGKNTIGALSAGSVVDLMGSRELSEGDTFGDMTVIHEDIYDITKTNYLDEHIESTTDDSFYYAVAWKLKAYGAKDYLNIIN